jgi:hypothetical protein
MKQSHFSSIILEVLVLNKQLLSLTYSSTLPNWPLVLQIYDPIDYRHVILNQNIMTKSSQCIMFVILIIVAHCFKSLEC